MSLQTCYASNGTILPDFGSCSSQIGDNVCCAAGQTCISNGLCATSDGHFYSGGCTDETYRSMVCPNFCTSGTTTKRFEAELLMTKVQVRTTSSYHAPPPMSAQADLPPSEDSAAQATDLCTAAATLAIFYLFLPQHPSLKLPSFYRSDPQRLP